MDFQVIFPGSTIGNMNPFEYVKPGLANNKPFNNTQYPVKTTLPETVKLKMFSEP